MRVYLVQWMMLFFVVACAQDARTGTDDDEPPADGLMIDGAGDATTITRPDGTTPDSAANDATRDVEGDAAPDGRVQDATADAGCSDPADTDGDGIGDACDICVFDPNVDEDCDGDGVDDACDSVEGVVCAVDEDCPIGGFNGAFSECVVPSCEEYHECGIRLCYYREENRDPNCEECLATADFENAETCFDGLDNDCDRLTDRNDLDCQPHLVIVPEDRHNEPRLFAVGTQEEPLYGFTVLGPAEVTAVGGNIRLTHMWWANNPRHGGNRPESSRKLEEFVEEIFLATIAGQENTVVAQGLLVDGSFETDVDVEIARDQTVQIWFETRIQGFDGGDTSGLLVAPTLYAVEAVDATTGVVLAAEQVVGVPSTTGNQELMDQGLTAAQVVFHRSRPEIRTVGDVGAEPVPDNRNTVYAWHVFVNGLHLYWREARVLIQGTCQRGQAHILDCIDPASLRLEAGVGRDANQIADEFVVTRPRNLNDPGEIYVTLGEDYYIENGVNDDVEFHLLGDVSDVRDGDEFSSWIPESRGDPTFSAYPIGSRDHVRGQSTFVWTDELFNPEGSPAYFSGRYAVYALPFERVVVEP